MAFYRADRISHIVFIAYGITGALIGVFYYFYLKTELSLGAMLGLSVFGAFQILVGSVRFYRSFNGYKLAIKSAEENFAYLKTKEHTWVSGYVEKIAQMRKIESIVFVLSFTLLLLFFFNRSDLYCGTFAGITLHAAVLLVFDLFMQFRMVEYQRQIEKL